MASKRPVRVAEIIRRAEGGMREHYLTLVKGLAEMGFEVLAACNFSSQTMKELEDKGAEIYRFELEDDVNLFSDIREIFCLYRKIKMFRADVVHCHGFKAGLTGRIAAFFAKCPSVYTVHNFMPQSAVTGIRLVVLRFIERILTVGTYKVITVSQALKDEMTGKLGLPCDMIKVVRNGIAPLTQSVGVDVRKQWGIPDDCILVGCIARLVPSKGLNYLIDAMPSIVEIKPDIMLLIAGDGPILQALKNQVRALRLEEKVIFTGFIDNAADYLSTFDIFILPSLKEGLGISIIEAMMAGKPVIASRTGGIPEVISDNVTGRLIKPGDSDEIKEALLSVVENPESMKAYAENGRKHAMENFGLQAMMSATAQILIGD